MPALFSLTWRRALVSMALAAAAFLLPQELPLEWYPLNDPGSDVNLLQVTFAADKEGEVQLFYDTGRGFNEIESIRIPVSPTKLPYTYTFPLPDAPLFDLRLDPLPAGGTMEIWDLRILNRAGQEIRRFLRDQISLATDIAAITPIPTGWTATSTPEAQSPQLLFQLKAPVVPIGMNARNLQRCLRSTGYLMGMLGLILLTVLVIVDGPATWRAAAPPVAFMGLLAFLFAAVANRGLIKESIHSARIAASLSVPASSVAQAVDSTRPQLLLRAGEKVGGIFGTGWWGQEAGFSWIARRAQVTFKSGPVGRITLKGHIAHLTPSNRISLRGNDTILKTQELTAGAFTLDCQVEPNTEINLVIELQHAVVPKEVGLNQDNRELAAIITDLSVE